MPPTSPLTREVVLTARDHERPPCSLCGRRDHTTLWRAARGSRVLCQECVRLPDDILRRIEVNAAACWIWRGGVTIDGLPSYRCRHRHRWGGTSLVHRITYTVLLRYSDPLPRTALLVPECGERLSARPEHLRVTTHAQAAKTHCLNGHEFNEVNTYTWHGKRRCRVCDRDPARARRTQPKGGPS